MNNINNYASNSTVYEKTGRGELIVKVTTGKYAIPIQGANVAIYDNEKSHSILFNLSTNSVGSTERIEIPTLPYEASQNPGGINPFSTVNIDVTKSGYTRMQFISVPIFDGVLSVQRADLVPQSENGENYIYDFKESEALEIPDNGL